MACSTFSSCEEDGMFCWLGTRAQKEVFASTAIERLHCDVVSNTLHFHSMHVTEQCNRPRSFHKSLVSWDMGISVVVICFIMGVKLNDELHH